MKKHALQLLLLAFFTTNHVFAGQKTNFINLCKQGEWEKVSNNISRSKNPTKAINENELPTCINRALCDGKIYIFNFLITLTDQGAQYASRVCINEAISRGYMVTLKNALKYGLDLSKTYRQENILHAAARSRKKSSELVTWLLAENIEHSARTGEPLFSLDQRSEISGRTPLGEALLQKAYGTAKILLAAGASLLKAVYINPHEKKPPTALTPDDSQVELVTAWLDKNKYKTIRSFINNSHNAVSHKKGIIRFLSHGLTESQQNSLEKIWKEYENNALDELLNQSVPDDASSSSEVSTASEPNGSNSDEFVASSENDPAALAEPKKRICLDICDEDHKKEYVALAACNHEICKGCARATVNHNLTDAEARLTCPAKDCHSHVLWENLDNLDISKLTILKLMIKAKEQELSDDPDFHHCQQPDCPGGNFTTFRYSDEKKQHFKCQLCGVIQCQSCGEHHPKVECKNIRLKQNERFIAQQIKNKTIKKCPQCSVIIEKNKGCDHMSCKTCKYEFWWSTLEPYVAQ